MRTQREEQRMKYLRINSEKGQFSINGSEWSDLDLISKHDLLHLMKLALQDDFLMDPYDKLLLPNPAQEIIYRHIFEKLTELNSKKESFKDESQMLYSEALQKYKV